MPENDLKKVLGTLIATLRKERGLSQERLAQEANIDRAYMGTIERGEANVTLETLAKVAKVLDQTTGALIVQAEELASGVAKRPAPTINPAYIDDTVPLPLGLTHDQLEKALNRAMALLYQIGLNPQTGDIQKNIYSGVVSNIVTKAIAEQSDLVQNKDTKHPDLYNPKLELSHRDYGLEMKATHNVGKGGESHNKGQGWFMVVVYNVVEEQTVIVQVETTYLNRDEWTIHERKEGSERTRTAITLPTATERLRAHSVYLHPDYATAVVLRAVRKRKQLPEQPRLL